MTERRRAVRPRPKAPRKTTPRARRAPVRSAPSSPVLAELLAPREPSLPRAPPVSPQPRPPPTAFSPRLRGYVVFAFILEAALVALSLALEAPWWAVTYDTIYFLLPCTLAAVLVGGTRGRMPSWGRVAIAAATGGAVFAGIAAGEPLLANVESLFLYLLPAIGAVVILGTARFRWTAPQIFGASLALLAVWRSVYLSFPDLFRVLTATGTLEPYSVGFLYETVLAKFVREVGFALVGVLFLFERFPFLQKNPLDVDDLPHVLRRLDAGVKRTPLLDLGLGCTALLGAFLGSYLLQQLISQSPGLQAGADDTQVFARITPSLVFLLSLSAGLGEELLFRALLQPSFERMWRAVLPTVPFLPLLLAVTTQAVLFGAVHAGYANPAHVLLPFGFGFLMGFVYRYWGFLPVVYAHTAVDVFAFGFDAAKNYPWMDVFLAAFFFANVGVGLTVPIYLLVRRYSRRRLQGWIPLD